VFEPPSDLEVKLQVLISVVEALAYLGLALWFLSRARDGGWARLGAVAAGLIGVTVGLYAAAAVETVFLHSARFAEKIYLHEHRQLVLSATEVLGVLLLVAAVVLSRRTPPAASSPTYGAD
jgi:cytochrome bd-type quinol oxidase subunit 2